MWLKPGLQGVAGSMKLAEALQVVQQEPVEGAKPFNVALVCGFTAHHAQIFLTAHLRTLFADRQVAVKAGLYGDFLGNLERFSKSSFEAMAVMLEWSDFDARLGIRQAGGWSPAQLPDILATVEAQARRFEDCLLRAAEHSLVGLCMPTLPLPPIAFTPGWQWSDFEIQLRAHVHSLATCLVRARNIRLINPQRLEQLSPPGERWDVKGELLSGFPYRTAHASIVAELLATALQVPVPKKGLITDLDDTLWRGLVGEAGPGGVTWNLDSQTHGHALYQQLLQSLAESGVLLGVATKNDPEPVEEAFRREDMLLQRDCVFPLEAHWGPKSASVQRILRTWNVGAQSVVFIDDSAVELAEVRAAHPQTQTFLFPKEQGSAVYDLLVQLRDLFGKSWLREEDRLRLDSLRSARVWPEQAQSSGTDQDSFLQSLDAEIALDTNSQEPDPRALELVNKTNQFNLNGRRYTEAEWLVELRRPDSFLYLVSYRDKFGHLGKIAVLGGRRQKDTLLVDTWVMSCRAFSRRIEHQCLALLFRHFSVTEIHFDFQETARNGPIQSFFRELLDDRPDGLVRLHREKFSEKCPALFHRVPGVAHE
jgi:FkbH-like protein